MLECMSRTDMCIGPAFCICEHRVRNRNIKLPICVGSVSSLQAPRMTKTAYSILFTPVSPHALAEPSPLYAGATPTRLPCGRLRPLDSRPLQRSKLYADNSPNPIFPSAAQLIPSLNGNIAHPNHSLVFALHQQHLTACQRSPFRDPDVPGQTAACL